jgi:hypothetical protein
MIFCRTSFSPCPALDAWDGRPNRGVYRRTGDELLCAVDATGDGPRPSSVGPAPDVRFWTLRRVRK